MVWRNILGYEKLVSSVYMDICLVIFGGLPHWVFSTLVDHAELPHFVGR